MFLVDIVDYECCMIVEVVKTILFVDFLQEFVS